MSFLITLILGLFRKKTGQERKIRKKDDRKTSIPREEIKKAVEPKVWEPLYKNEANRLRLELLTLRRVNRDVYDMMYDLAQWVGDNFEKETIITMIFRTQEEQEQIYGKGYTKKSPHQFYHAVDIRSRIFSDDEIKKIEDYLNNKYNDTNYYKWTAKNHKVAGGAYHFHIQYIKK